MAPMVAPVCAPMRAPMAAPSASPVAAAPRTAPVTAPQPAPCPVAVSHEERPRETSARAQGIRKLFFFIMLSVKKLRLSKSDGSRPARIQAKSEKLAGDAASLLQLAQPIFFLENAKPIRLHAPEQGAINGGHDFGRDHGAPVF